MTDSVPQAPVLPQTAIELANRNVSLKARTLFDDVNDAHLRSWDDPNYRRWFGAIHPSQTIEGAFVADDYQAATMLRDFAKLNRLPILADAKLAAIVYALHWICRRYNMSRQQLEAEATNKTSQMSEAAD